ncbi:DUF1659 domain-containing protein [Desulfitobacterium sp. AusDCA]|uniref:DUF1659 domain-containing protein n=1 Tax=Desulfitobacterium sp. AusDCA TaxID=3240383 RepID=UPI003DA7463E
MAVTSVAKESVLVVTYQTGVNASGAPILRQRSFPNILAAAPDQDVFDVANALYALQQYPLTAVRRDNRFELA